MTNIIWISIWDIEIVSIIVVYDYILVLEIEN